MSFKNPIINDDYDPVVAILNDAKDAIEPRPFGLPVRSISKQRGVVFMEHDDGR